MIVNKAWGGVKPLTAICQCRWIAVCLVVLATAVAMVSQSVERPSRITHEIDSNQLVTLHGHVRADLASAPDLGPVEDELPLRLYLVLQRTPEQQAELDNLIARQQQPTAPEYHKWLTPQEFGARFGASPEDIAKITMWLESRGLRVNGAMNNNMFIDFSATAGQVREVFRAEMHYFNIRGGKHAANVQDPMIPAALAPVVSGIKGLSKIPPVPLHTKVHATSYDKATHSWKRPESEGGALSALPAFNNGTAYGFEEYDVTPQDYYTIYNVNNVFNGGANLGAGATIAVIEESDFEYESPFVLNTTGPVSGGDVANFRSLFGVPGTLNMHVYHGYGSVSCSDPGIDPENEGEETEAALDAEWVNALAPSANLIFMSCDQSPDQGIFTSMAALIDGDLADAMSLSYGDSENDFATDPAEYTAQDTLYAQAAAQGQSFIVASGDGGSDVNDWVIGSPTATTGYSVNAFGAPSVTVAGGTDFSDFYDWLENNPTAESSTTWGSTYWGSSNTNYGDALSYVPETAWNDSCAGSIVAKLAGGPGSGYTGAQYCASLTATDVDGTVAGGSGGFSTHYAVPAYQSGITGYSGSMRAQPDISGFGSNGYWNHALIFCDSYTNAADPNAPGSGTVPVTSCTSTATFGEAGGTSFVAPALAGVTGLLVTATGGRQGLLNPGLYALAKAQFTASATKSACYSNGQTSNTGLTTGHPASSCIFNDVTTGNNDVPCATGSTDCYVDSGAEYGMLSLGGSGSLKVAYPSTAGYDEATGIGTLNVYNLITKWNTAFTSSTALTANPTTIAAVGSTTLTATVTGGVPTGSTYTPALNGTMNFAAGSTALGSCTLSGSSCSLMVSGSALQTGANSITATFVSGSYATSTSSIVTVTVGANLKTQTITFPNPGTQNYGVGSITLTATGGGSGKAVTYTVVSGSATVSGSKLTITGVGSITVQASQAGNSSYAAATPVSVEFTVNPVPLTVVANDAVVALNATLPTLSGTLTGVIAGDGITASYTTAAVKGSPVGTYAITPVLSNPNGKLADYSVSITNASLVIFNTASPLALWLSPGSATAGGAGFTLTVSGANFTSKSVVLWNGSERTTKYVSSTQLTATILAADIAKDGTSLVTVAKPSPSAGTSSALPFVVQSSTPVATITGASLANGSGGSQVLVLTGTDFIPGSKVMWGSLPLATTYISASELSAVVTTVSLPATVTVVNPSGTSNGFEVE
jgi:pro-kumamolisin-like protein/MBG domain-containing protein